jgi:triacylglycerol esterase/lipase EstA (alpha/beta hydrolase family)
MFPLLPNYIFVKIQFIVLSINLIKANETKNTYLIHGIGSTTEQVSQLEIALQDNGIPVYNLGLNGDPLKSIFTNLDKQCNLYNDEIIKSLIYSTNSTLPSGNVKINININIIAISQGGLIARCLVEKYNGISYSVNNIITIASPHMGVYYTNGTQSDWIHTVEEITFSEYWKDPYTYKTYLESNKFLSRLNNEVEHNEYEKFKYNFMNINKLVLIWSNIDTVIQPPQSSIFNYWNIEKAEKENLLVLDMVNTTKWYLEDKLGFQHLVKNDRILEYMFPCIHDEFKLPQCFNNSSITVNNKNLLDTLIEFLCN